MDEIEAGIRAHYMPSPNAESVEVVSPEATPEYEETAMDQ